MKAVPFDLELLELFADEPELLALSLLIRDLFRLGLLDDLRPVPVRKRALAL